MSKKTKQVELKYEPVERVSRWNYCQQIASALYKSDITTNEIIDIATSATEVALIECLKS